MSNRKKVSFDILNGAEKASVNRFVQEAHALFVLSKTNKSFCFWLDMLTEGIHEAYQRVEKKSS